MAVRLRVARFGFVGLAIVALIVYYAVPLAKPVWAGLLGVASVGAISAGVWIFRPQRWADGPLKRLPKFAYFPFGGGPRVCIGKEFALLETALILATIMRRFRFRTRCPLS